MRVAFCASCLMLALLLNSVSEFVCGAPAQSVQSRLSRSQRLPSFVQLTTAGDEGRLAQFEQSLDLLRQQYRIPGLSAAIVSNQQLLWTRGYGFQDLSLNIPATPDTPYRIASLTKIFASTLLMRCVERQRLDLNTPIINYTTSITQPGVRVRHVFTHTSESTPPGGSFRYNGNRYAALTPVVDACAGRPFREELAKTILDSLEMRDSVPGQDMEFPAPEVAARFAPETLDRYVRVLRRLARPYRIDGSGQIVLSTYPNRGISASAGLISTVRDLARYDAAIDRHLFITTETQEAAWTNPFNSRGQILPYANGWFVQRRSGVRLIWHYGLWPDSFSSLILKVPSRNLTLILLANSDGLSAPFGGLGGAGNVTASPFANLFLQMLDDPEAFRGNPIDQTSFFVRQHYIDFLGREPDPAGFQGWQNILNNCAAGSTACDRIEVSSAFFRSTEFQQRGYFVYRFYSTALGRFPHYSEFMPDLARVSGFLTEAEQEANKVAFINEFMSRAEFRSRYDALTTAAAYVDELLRVAGVSLPQREALIGDLAAGRKTRGQVLRQIVESAEVYQHFYNEAFVVMQYFGYLRRDPDALYQNWIQTLNTSGDYRLMVNGFVNSLEYRQRFGS